MKGRILGLAALVGLCWACVVKAEVIVPVQQVLHCYAQASHYMIHQSAEDKPADVVVGAVYGSYSHRAATSVSGTYEVGPGYFEQGGAYASASVDATVRGDSLLISVHGGYTYGDATGGGGKVESNVKVTYDLTKATLFELNLSVTSHAIGNVTIMAGGQRIGGVWVCGALGDRDWLPPMATYDNKTGITSTYNEIVLEPGRYDVEMGYEPYPRAGNLGWGTATFSMAAVPEVGVVGMMVMMGVGLLGVRRR